MKKDIIDLEKDEFVSSVDSFCSKTDGKLENVVIRTNMRRNWNNGISQNRVTCGSFEIHDVGNLKLAYLGEEKDRNFLLFWTINFNITKDVWVGLQDHHGHFLSTRKGVVKSMYQQDLHFWELFRLEFDDKNKVAIRCYSGK